MGVLSDKSFTYHINIMTDKELEENLELIKKHSNFGVSKFAISVIEREIRKRKLKCLNL